jgi:CelD/BcsL family acetyltransferase involved in cellulose biosynthesis
LFSSRPWTEVLARTYGFEISASARLGRDGRVEAAILFSHIRDLRGERVVCLPFSDYCDPLVEDPAAWDELTEPLLRLGAPVRLRCLRNTIPDGDGRFEVLKQAKWHGADLTRSEDELWAGLSGSARQNVRQAERNGLVVREGRRFEDVRIFHRLHVHLRKAKYRMLAQPAAMFENLHALFAPGDQLVVLLAEMDGEPVAGILLLQWRDVLYYKFNASAEQRFRPNDLLLWNAMLLGRRRGLTRLDFGLSDADQPGLIRYKQKFATEEQDVRFLEWRPNVHLDPRPDQAAQVLGGVTRLLTDPSVPDEITQAAGDQLYRFFA